MQPPTCVTAPGEPLLHEIDGKGTVPVLQLAEEQQEYIVPVPLVIVLDGHVNVDAHEYIVFVNTPAL